MKDIISEAMLFEARQTGDMANMMSGDELRAIYLAMSRASQPFVDSEAVERARLIVSSGMQRSLKPSGIVDELVDGGLLSLANPVGGWQPIETAPKDGTEVLLLSERGSVFAPCVFQMGGLISEDDLWLVWRAYDFDEVVNPTHWQPLPAALTTMKEDDRG